MDQPDLRDVYDEGDAWMSRAMALLTQKPFAGIKLREPLFACADIDTAHIDTLLRVYRALMANNLGWAADTEYTQALAKIFWGNFGISLERDLKLKADFVEILTGSVPEHQIYQNQVHSAKQLEMLLIHIPPEKQPLFNADDFVLATHKLTIGNVDDPVELSLLSGEAVVLSYISVWCQGDIWELQSEINQWFLPRNETSEIILCKFPQFLRIDYVHKDSNLADGSFAIPPPSFVLEAYRLVENKRLEKIQQLYKLLVIWRMKSKSDKEFPDACKIMSPSGFEYEAGQTPDKWDIEAKMPEDVDCRLIYTRYEYKAGQADRTYDRYLDNNIREVFDNQVVVAKHVFDSKKAPKKALKKNQEVEYCSPAGSDETTSPKEDNRENTQYRATTVPQGPPDPRATRAPSGPRALRLPPGPDFTRFAVNAIPLGNRGDGDLGSRGTRGGGRVGGSGGRRNRGRGRQN